MRFLERLLGRWHVGRRVQLPSATSESTPDASSSLTGPSAPKCKGCGKTIIPTFGDVIAACVKNGMAIEWRPYSTPQLELHGLVAVGTPDIYRLLSRSDPRKAALFQELVGACCEGTCAVCGAIWCWSCSNPSLASGEVRLSEWKSPCHKSIKASKSSALRPPTRKGERRVQAVVILGRRGWHNLAFSEARKAVFRRVCEEVLPSQGYEWAEGFHHMMMGIADMEDRVLPDLPTVCQRILKDYPDLGEGGLIQRTEATPYETPEGDRGSYYVVFDRPPPTKPEATGS